MQLLPISKPGEQNALKLLSVLVQAGWHSDNLLHPVVNAGLHAARDVLCRVGLCAGWGHAHWSCTIGIHESLYYVSLHNMGYTYYRRVPYEIPYISWYIV